MQINLGELTANRFLAGKTSLDIDVEKFKDKDVPGFKLMDHVFGENNSYRVVTARFDFDEVVPFRVYDSRVFRIVPNYSPKDMKELIQKLCEFEYDPILSKSMSSFTDAVLRHYCILEYLKRMS